MGEFELAGELLWEWYLYSKSWKPALGYPGADPACRQSVSSKQHDTTTEIVEETCDRITIQRTDECVNELDGKYQNAIGCEMRNREVGAKVWHPKMGATYRESVEKIIPFMKKKNLL